MALLDGLRRALGDAVARFAARAVWVEGPLAGAEEPVRCLFVGSVQSTEGLVWRIFGDAPRIIRRRILIRALPSLLRRADPPLDLCVAELPRRFDSELGRRCHFRGQRFVRQIVDVPATWEELKTKLHRNARDSARLIRKAGLTARLSTDAQDLRFFYDRMFVPHTRRRFAESADIEPFEDMLAVFPKGFLLLIEEAGRPIAGSLCLLEDGVLTYRRMGVLDADEAHSRKGAQMAVYHFSLQLALERGIRQFDLMKSHAFLNDGVYQHKKKWGATAYADREATSWVYFFNQGPPQRVASFYRRHPVIVVTPEGLKGVVGLEDGAELSPERARELAEHHAAPGLAGLLVLTSRSSSPQEVPFGGP